MKDPSFVHIGWFRVLLGRSGPTTRGGHQHEKCRDAEDSDRGAQMGCCLFSSHRVDGDAKSDVKKDGFLFSLETYVEGPVPWASGVGLSHQRVTPVRRHKRKDRIAIVGAIPGKVNSRVELLEHSAGEDCDRQG